jgi:formamidopyrimidine-DNA glycosylase
VPELPDVEGFRRVFASHAVGLPVRRVEVLDAGVLRDVTAEELSGTLVGRRFAEPRRHGKWLIAPAGSHAVVLHFGMTGSLHWAGAERERHRHDRVIFAFPGGELRYRDMRKLQGLRLVDHPRGVDELLAGVAPDATEVSAEKLAELLGGRRRQVKAMLVDQSVVAGIGNLLADEILWRARVNPRAPCVQCGHSDFARLATAMRGVLRQSLQEGRVPAKKSWLTGRRDEPSGSCPRCGTVLAHDRTGGRTTTWCPRCQPADRS